MKDLVDPLDPNHDPFEETRRQFFLLLDILQELLGAGFRFRLWEEHFGDVCWHELQNIVAWTCRDLEDTGVWNDCPMSIRDLFSGHLTYCSSHLPHLEFSPIQSHYDLHISYA